MGPYLGAFLMTVIEDRGFKRRSVQSARAGPTVRR
jgi:hypothetical protein